MEIAQKQIVKQQVNNILLDISWAHLSKKYFGKSRSWLNHKINGVDSNGGQKDFSEDEKQKLKMALIDLSSRILQAANNIK